MNLDKSTVKRLAIQSGFKENRCGELYNIKSLQSFAYAVIADFVAGQEPFGYFKAEDFCWTDCAETDKGAIALYDLKGE